MASERAALMRVWLGDQRTHYVMCVAVACGVDGWSVYALRIEH